MARKTLSSVIGNEATRQLELPNLDGTAHAAGTRGVIAKSIYTDTWGFMPLTNKGYLKTYKDTTMDQFWVAGLSSQPNDNSPRGGTCATFIAPNGDCLVAAWLQPETWNSVSSSNRDLHIYAFDADTGDLLQAFVPSISSNLSYNGGNENNEMDMQIWNPATDFYVCQVKHRLTTGRVQLHGFNYNTSTQTLSTGSVTTQFTMLSGTALTTPKFHYSMNNAITNMAVLYPDSVEACEWKTVPISGSAGAYTLGAFSLADNVSMDGSGALFCKAGGNSHVHRLSNDDVIIFGMMITGSTTSIAYQAAGNYFINIMDNMVAGITQNYYLMDEVPGSAISKKFYWHHCLYSWEIATDTYILLTKCSSKTNTTSGPAGFWSDDDGYHHVRAIKIVVNPADNTLTQTDLGQFDSSLFQGNIFNDTMAEGYRDRSSVYDWHMDITNKRVYMITKTYMSKLQFNSDWTATDVPNSDIVFAPLGPRGGGHTTIVASTDVYSVTSLNDWVRYDNRIFSEHIFAYDHVNKRMWQPMYLTFDIVSSNYPGACAMVTYDMEQCSGTALEVMVASADANTVQCIADYDVFDNNGVPVGTAIGNTFAITANQVISKRPAGQLLDVLIGNVFKDGSFEDWMYMLPEDLILFNWQDTPLRINKGSLTYATSLGSNIFNDDNAMVFNAAGMDTVQDAAYEGPMFQWDNLDSDLWVWFESGATVTDYGSILVVSDGWWVAGSQSHTVLGASSGKYKIGYQLKPTVRVEMNGRDGGGAPTIYMLKFKDSGKDRHF